MVAEDFKLNLYFNIYKDYPIIISKTKMGEISSAIATTLSIQKYNVSV